MLDRTEINLPKWKGSWVYSFVSLARWSNALRSPCLTTVPGPESESLRHAKQLPVTRLEGCFPQALQFPVALI